MTARPLLTVSTTDALQRALAKEWLDGADLRLIDLLVSRAPQADGDALALVLAALCRACREGSLCLSLQRQELVGALRELLSSGTPGDDPLSAAGAVPADSFLADLGSGRLAPVCAQPERSAPRAGTGAPDNPVPLIAAYDRLYFHRFWHAQRLIAETLSKKAGVGADDATRARDAAIREALRETLVDNPLRTSGAQGGPLKLALRQQWALVAALREPVFVLSGGPGTGKTTWTASWLRALLRLPGVTPDRIRLCAPTGRAAQRLQESLRKSLESVSPATTGPAGATGSAADLGARDLQTTTLHTLLGFQPFTGAFARRPGDPLDADYVLVDEASMVDVFLLTALLRALRPGTRLVLVGDADQLPPVDAGSVLGDLLPPDRLPRLPATTRDAIAAIFPDTAALLPADRSKGPESSAEIPSVMLDESHRARGSVIPLVAALLAGDADETIRRLGNTIDPGETATDRKKSLTAALYAFAETTYLVPRVEGKTFPEWLDLFRTTPRGAQRAILEPLWKFVEAARVLAPLREGLFSAANANRILRERLEPRWGRPEDAPKAGFHGAPILITRNDRTTGLSNGEIGLWLESGGGPAVFFPRPELPDAWLRLPVSQLPAHEPGFAVTVHKSQGSEYDAVLLILPEAGNRLLARETLYTAVTRARRAVTIYGSESAIREAVERRLRRPGGLREMFPG